MTNHLRRNSNEIFYEIQKKVEDAEAARKELDYILLDWKRTNEVPETRMQNFYELKHSWYFTLAFLRCLAPSAKRFSRKAINSKKYLETFKNESQE